MIINFIMIITTTCVTAKVAVHAADSRAVRCLQTIEDIDHHLDFAIRRYKENKQITSAVDKVQTKVGCVSDANCSSP